MPLTHISLRAGKPESYRQAIFDSLYRAMHETFNVPLDNQFMTISEHDASNFRYGATYLDIPRTDDLVFIQMTVNRQSQSLKEVEEEVGDIQENIEELGENVEELGENVEDLKEDVEDIQEDIGEIGEDTEDVVRDKKQDEMLEALTNDVRAILKSLESLKAR